MAPVALYAPTSISSKDSTKAESSCSSQRSVPVSTTMATVIPRRPSPWHEIEHALSTAAHSTTSTRRASSPNIAIPSTTPMFIDESALQMIQPPSPSPALPTLPALSSSQALREWEERLMSPEPDVYRHQLVHPPSTSTTNSSTPKPHTQNHTSASSHVSPVLPPKLAAERDKEGHIEYKLKLIEPSPERFGKLVTQMMWRLKQGKNEAIYELGLADDGTVVGLTRAEMDASLRTLELMASELGATVMILREIVLSAHPPPDRIPDSAFSDISSSGISLSSSAYSTDGGDIHRWPVRRPDLDANGLPRKGTKGLNASGEVEMAKVIKKPSKEYIQSQSRSHKQVYFDSRDIEEDGIEGEGSEGSSPSGLRRSRRDTDDEISQFHLDLEEPKLECSPPNKGRSWGRRHRKKEKTIEEPVISESMLRKSNNKRLKAAQKREARRLDLLRGDGTSPHWMDATTSENFLDDPGGPNMASLPTVPIKLPHQPARPSSLRLSAAPPTTSSSGHQGNDDEDGSMWGLSHMPLDSLSLSFANVQIEDISPPSSPSSDTEYAMPLHEDGFDDSSNTDIGRPIIRPFTGEEMICVEALVVRKVQHGHGADGDGRDEEEEECGWGGEDDVWGFGVDDD